MAYRAVHQHVLDMILAHPEGATVRELWQEDPTMDRDAAKGAVIRLRQDGMIEMVRKDPNTRVITWRATPRAHPREEGRCRWGAATISDTSTARTRDGSSRSSQPTRTV